jgi:hypothetical protein
VPPWPSIAPLPRRFVARRGASQLPAPKVRCINGSVTNINSLLQSGGSALRSKTSNILARDAPPHHTSMCHCHERAGGSGQNFHFSERRDTKTCPTGIWGCWIHCVAAQSGHRWSRACGGCRQCPVARGRSRHRLGRDACVDRLPMAGFKARGATASAPSRSRRARAV